MEIAMKNYDEVMENNFDAQLQHDAAPFEGG